MKSIERFTSNLGDAAETDEKCTDFYSYACNDMKKSGVLRRNEWTDREKNGKLDL